MPESFDEAPVKQFDRPSSLAAAVCFFSRAVASSRSAASPAVSTLPDSADSALATSLFMSAMESALVSTRVSCAACRSAGGTRAFISATPSSAAALALASCSLALASESESDWSFSELRESSIFVQIAFALATYSAWVRAAVVIHGHPVAHGKRRALPCRHHIAHGLMPQHHGCLGILVPRHEVRAADSALARAPLR